MPGPRRAPYRHTPAGRAKRRMWFDLGVNHAARTVWFGITDVRDERAHRQWARALARKLRTAKQYRTAATYDTSAAWAAGEYLAMRRLGAALGKFFDQLGR